jgi:DNA polymerase-4
LGSRPVNSGTPVRQIASPLVRWLFLDLNSYFASVEQELQPQLRGKPVAVVPLMADTTSCIAASYEAKAFGVKTGVKVGDAKRMCPGLQLVEARHKEYVEYHHRIIQAVELCVPVSAVLSIDEMACSLMGREQNLLRALELGRQVKLSVQQHAGSTLRCSIGLAPNRYLAKIASDMEKPDGLVALTPDILHEALSGLVLRDLPGVGARMEQRLNAAGVHTMPQLLAQGREGMRALWNGVAGDKLWFWLQGEDFNDPKLEHQKSISQSHVLGPELRTAEGAYAVLHKLLHKAAMRLRAAKLWTTHVTLSIKFAVPRDGRRTGTASSGALSGGSSARSRAVHTSGLPQSVWSQGASVIECQDTQTLVEALAALWAKRPQGPQHQVPFYVGVWLGELVPDHLHTLSLFSGIESEPVAKRTRLSATMDQVNTRYGTNMLSTASMLLARAAAPTRIAFTNIPDLF